MPRKLYKVWNLAKKKMVLASSLQELMTSGKQKLGLEGNAVVKAYMQDGTEIDDDEILQALEPLTVTYLLQQHDEKPWDTTNRIISVEEFNLERVPVPPVNLVENNTPEPSFIEPNESPNFVQNLLQPWPDDFRLPVHNFSTELNDALAVGSLNWRSKSELLAHISREIMKYTLKPSPRQRDQVARYLVALFPNLKSKVGEGHHGWAQKIYDKMNEEAKRRNVSVKRYVQSTNAKCVKLPRRGEVNFAPQESVSETVLISSKQFLTEQFLKPVSDRNSAAVAEHMRITFSDRRLLVSQKCSVADLRIEYPMLFTEEGIFLDFQLINNFELESRFLERLHKCAENIKQEAILAKKDRKQGAAITSLLSETDSFLHVTALRLLPHLLADKDYSSFYRIYDFDTKPNDIKYSGPETVHVAVLGNINDYDCLCFVLVEKEHVLTVSGFVKAVMLMFGIYFCCNMEYADGCSRTLKFIQTYLLNMPEATKLPSKLITFSSKMP